MLRKSTPMGERESFPACIDIPPHFRATRATERKFGMHVSVVELNGFGERVLQKSTIKGILRQEGTLNIRQAASPLVELVEGEERRTFSPLLRGISWVSEDFGKRNIPGKRARRHFSQLSEFERGLIIGMKTAGWSAHRVASQVDHSECAVRNCWEQWTREGTHARKTGSGATRKTTRREDRRIMRQTLVDPTVTRSTIRAAAGVAIVPQTISRDLAEANLKSKRPFRALL
ncbi:transposable element Tc1 transposase [Trichonephila clavipes]|nr:transposable element Tc1 transposase [Trichonephila clavipes]